MARRSLRVATYLRCTLLTRPEHDMCRRSQILRIYWALSTHACAASSRDGATAAFLTGRRSKLRTGTLFNFHAKDGSVNSVGMRAGCDKLKNRSVQRRTCRRGTWHAVRIKRMSIECLSRKVSLCIISPARQASKVQTILRTPIPSTAWSSRWGHEVIIKPPE